LYTTLLLIDMMPPHAKTVANIRIYLTLPETTVSGEHFLLPTVLEYFYSFSHSCLRKRGRKNLV